MGKCMGKIGDVQAREGSVEWRIPHFFSLSNTIGEYYESVSFRSAGERWHLRLFPANVGVVLVKEASSAGSSATFAVGLKRADGTFHGDLAQSRTFRSGEETWDFSFPSKSTIEQSSYELAPSGVLTIVCCFGRREPVQGLPPAARYLSILPKDPVVRKESREEVNDCSNDFLLAKTRQQEFDKERHNVMRHEESKYNGSSKQKISHEKYRRTSAEASTQTQFLNPVPVKEPSELVKETKQTKLKYCTEKLSHDFGELLLSGEDSDLTVLVNGVQFRLHRLIMKARVPVFCAMLRHDTREKATGVVHVHDCDADVFRAFVRYVYNGRVEQPSADTVFGLFALADKYQVDELKSVCLEYVQSTLSVDTFCDVVTLALTYDRRELLEQAMGYFARRMEDILKTVKWMNFMKDHFVEANELMLNVVQRKNPK